MSIEVGAFTALAKAEFQDQLLAVYAKPYPADIDQLVDSWPSTEAVEVYPYMTNIPRLRVFKRDSPAVQFAADRWQCTNVTYRQGPVVVQQETLADDRIGGYLKAISAMPA